MSVPASGILSSKHIFQKKDEVIGAKNDCRLKKTEIITLLGKISMYYTHGWGRMVLLNEVITWSKYKNDRELKSDAQKTSILQWFRESLYKNWKCCQRSNWSIVFDRTPLNHSYIVQ